MRGETPGGGGWGDPAERDPQERRRDNCNANEPAERGETEKSRAALQRAKKAMDDMPDSSGMGKMFVVPGVLGSQIGVGEYDSVAESIR